MQVNEHYFISDCGDYYGLYKRRADVGKLLSGCIYKDSIERLRAYIGANIVVVREYVYNVTWA